MARLVEIVREKVDIKARDLEMPEQEQMLLF
jgi:hypothetical protein